jgi:hypothetical protein
LSGQQVCQGVDGEDDHEGGQSGDERQPPPAARAVDVDLVALGGPSTLPGSLGGLPGGRGGFLSGRGGFPLDGGFLGELFGFLSKPSGFAGARHRPARSGKAVDARRLGHGADLLHRPPEELRHKRHHDWSDCRADQRPCSPQPRRQKRRSCRSNARDDQRLDRNAAARRLLSVWGAYHSALECRSAPHPVKPGHPSQLRPMGAPTTGFPT